MKSRKLLTLSLLNSDENGGLEGRTRLQKLLFLIQQRLDEQDNSLDKDYNFIAYDYGPFSKDIYDDIESLIDRDLVTEDAKKLDDGVIKYDYELTEKGEEYISNVRELLGDRQNTIDSVKDEFKNKELQKIIEYVYSEYPEYAEESVLY